MLLRADSGVSVFGAVIYVIGASVQIHPECASVETRAVLIPPPARCGCGSMPTSWLKDWHYPRICRIYKCLRVDDLIEHIH
jgi:hypothetical protein